jgi:hypothetical protein
MTSTSTSTSTSTATSNSITQQQLILLVQYTNDIIISGFSITYYITALLLSIVFIHNVVYEIPANHIVDW